ncbi:hypothetical protein ANCCEY_13662 [Ancylostoma ceylanicum]|uniref:Serpin domain-containing protein n=1 Tax=Ancylostoma ceylanicum TaxID=53326 RepID=A0A0D6L701_9BILA|nr:hypothetical protein ANCCEY_13662 [Ancylostoma ceylanicum]
MKIESDYKLKEALIMMGVTDMFNDSADLSGIAKSPHLKVSKALHRAIIESLSQTSTFSMFLVAETDFGLRMLRQGPVNESLVVSPLSVIFALAMVQAGAKGSTKGQINKLIAEGTTDDDIVDYYSGLSQQVLQASHGVQSRIANGFFLK